MKIELGKVIIARGKSMKEFNKFKIAYIMVEACLNNDGFVHPGSDKLTWMIYILFKFTNLFKPTSCV